MFLNKPPEPIKGFNEDVLYATSTDWHAERASVRCQGYRVRSFWNMDHIGVFQEGLNTGIKTGSPRDWPTQNASPQLLYIVALKQQQQQQQVYCTSQLVVGFVISYL